MYKNEDNKWIKQEKKNHFEMTSFLWTAKSCQAKQNAKGTDCLYENNNETLIIKKETFLKNCNV